jgi:hypothetical protein
MQDGFHVEWVSRDLKGLVFEPIVLLEKTAMWLWSQRPLYVPGAGGHQGDGQENNNQKKMEGDRHNT